MKRTCLLLALVLALAPFSASFAADHAPIVFAHGLGISAEAYETVVPMKQVFRDLGYDVRIAHTPVAGSISERAQVLAEEIRRLVPEGPFHLIGHSMGGLDARLAIHDYGLGSRCLSLTTLSTPHRGSPVADYVLAHLSDSDAIEEAATRIFSHSMRAVSDLTVEHMAEFNRKVTDDPRVRYFSMGFYIPEPVELHSIVPWLWLLHGIIADAGQPDNDALVSVESARWGTYLGTFEGDHYSETSEIPLVGGPSYREIFARVVENIEKTTGF